MCDNPRPAPKVNQPPVIQLNLHAAVPASLTIPQGGNYPVCSARVQPSKEAPCELGASVIDPEDGDLSYKVRAVACQGRSTHVYRAAFIHMHSSAASSAELQPCRLCSIYNVTIA